MNGQQYSNVPYQTQTYFQPATQGNVFIVQTENNHTRITIVQASDTTQFKSPPPKIEEIESEGDLSHDSLDDLVLGNFEYKEKAVDVPDSFEPDSLMIGNSLESKEKEMEKSPFKRRLNAPPIRQSRGYKVRYVYVLLAFLSAFLSIISKKAPDWHLWSCQSFFLSNSSFWSF